ncbi:MAG TPA: 5'-nucleotidase, lipoprotein e(P4) family [Flavobacterium sp.]|nr:5'-nucleotidase, lipoprotein e(P4) family [Flavobacterium sp.]
MMVNRKILVIIVAYVFLFFGCNATIVKRANKDLEQSNLNRNVQSYSVKSVLWQQSSGEYRALAYQAFRLAHLELDKMLLENKNNESLVIITDIDETILDNSPFFGKLIELNENFSNERWSEWEKKINAKSVPGAVEFFQYAANKGVGVFYISNRYDAQLNQTLTNLKNIGFPFADKEHVLLKTDSSAKETRRNKVSTENKIIMLLGDNLSDFSNVFENSSMKKRNDLVESLKEDFGRKFIVLPNPMYGDWESQGIYEGRYNWTPKEKDSIIRSKLISY